ncbi:putative Transaldolase Phosphoglucose isomerase (plasmid) [Scytonema sp. HK-05]|uniref:hypothetical protein n=1 Tax=Scytonema sp. HK-05 TaxID=1137095 RepID=UPI000936E167|nr:hypothetical protein [Scytonema sp. HK-05]OKH59424.1 hypothetical protein NIES2130_08865 [Scytonema sp. HK-05]BAY50100.1 putative Transaldolase Phosphoglucose isomerase [Scytonema sp. HK-05]
MTALEIITNPLQALQNYRQSIWLDYIRRSLISSDVQRVIDEDGVRGEPFQKRLGFGKELDDLT